MTALAGLTAAGQVKSPNGKLTAEANGQKLELSFDKRHVMEIDKILAEGASLKFLRPVKANYRMLAGKRLHCTNEANEYEALAGEGARLVLRLYNNGIAFRYEYDGLQAGQVPKEQTAYCIPEGTRRWIQQWTDAYEVFFPLSTT